MIIRSLHSQNEPSELHFDGYSEAMDVLEQGTDTCNVQVEPGKGLRN